MRGTQVETTGAGVYRESERGARPLGTGFGIMPGGGVRVEDTPLECRTSDYVLHG